MKCVPLLALTVAGCSTKTVEHEACGDRSFFVPAGLSDTSVAGEDTALTLIAFTLVKGTSGGAELYAAARNDGTTPVCEPGMLTSFFDQSGDLVTSVGSTLEAAQFYRLEDGTVVRCVAPGEVAMCGNTALPPAIVIEELGHLEHAFPAFVVSGITPVAGPTVTDIRTVRTLDGTAYTGTFTNVPETPAPMASVVVFPLNAVGRPVGMATAGATETLAPGETWSFQTSPVRDPGVGALAYPSQ